MDAPPPGTQPADGTAGPVGFQPEPYGSYYLIDQLAVGGMAEIFRAKRFSDAGFEKLLVIKRILQHLSENAEFISMFIDEAKITVDLQHANIVQIYDFGKIRANYYIAMEYVDGKDVKELLRKLGARRKLLPEEFAVFIAHEVAKGLDYAHKKTNLQGDPLHIIHRDMSPSNILVSYTGEVKIADFGIAKAASRIHSTKDGVLKGKFEYLSPEQARGEEVTQQSDLFSAGIILYEMLTGRRLFKTDSEVKTLEKIKALEISPPSALNPNLGSRLDEIVMRALTKDATDRYANAAEFQAALADYMYPSSAAAIQRSLNRFMHELFAEDRLDERGRLERGSSIALELHLTNPQLDIEPEWEDKAGAEPSLKASSPAPPSRVPLVVALVASLLLLLAVGIYAVVAPGNGPPVEATAPTTGRVTLQLGAVAAKVYAGDTLLGEGSTVDLPGLEPGAHTLRIEAPGHLTREATVDVVAGERVVLPLTLLPEGPEGEEPGTPPEDKAPPPPPVQPAAATPATPTPAEQAAPKADVLRFTSSPPGAQVLINGALAGRTDMTWAAGTAGQAYQVTYVLEGYEEASFTARVGDGGRTVPYGETLQRKAVEMGSLNVNTTRSWGYVYVDGTRLQETTPLFGYKLPAGTHTIRVVNEQLGLDQTRTVRVSGDETSTVTISVD